MADMSEEDRLEAALERIARAVASPPANAAAAPVEIDAAITARLDRLITTVRGALAAAD